MALWDVVQFLSYLDVAIPRDYTRPATENSSHSKDNACHRPNWDAAQWRAYTPILELRVSMGSSIAMTRNPTMTPIITINNGSKSAVIAFTARSTSTS